MLRVARVAENSTMTILYFLLALVKARGKESKNSVFKEQQPSISQIDIKLCILQINSQILTLGNINILASGKQKRSIKLKIHFSLK